MKRLTSILTAAGLVALAACANENTAAPPAAPATTTAATDTPAVPATPAAPATPAVAATPATPATPAVPATPATPAVSSLSVTPNGDVTVGKAPPDFTTKASNGQAVHLTELKGKPVVVYFYPKDETPGCTKEACSFRDSFDKLSKKGVVLIGVSADTDESHRAFADHQKLPFLLVSDPNGELAKAYGVPFKDGYSGRQTFVIGADGNVKKIYRKVDVTVHAQEVGKDVGA